MQELVPRRAAPVLRLRDRESPEVEAALVGPAPDRAGPDVRIDAVGAHEREVTALVEAHADFRGVCRVVLGPRAVLPGRRVETEIEHEVRDLGDLLRGLGDVLVQRRGAAHERHANGLAGRPGLDVAYEELETAAAGLQGSQPLIALLDRGLDIFGNGVEDEVAGLEVFERMAFHDVAPIQDASR